MKKDSIIGPIIIDIILALIFVNLPIPSILHSKILDFVFYLIFIPIGFAAGGLIGFAIIYAFVKILSFIFGGKKPMTNAELSEKERRDKLSQEAHMMHHFGGNRGNVG
jgi:hypothetical protein